MNRLPRLSPLALVPALFIWLGSTPPASAANAVFLSNDVAESEVTYVVQIQSFVARHVAKVRILLPPDTDSAHAALGRITIGSTSITGSVALLSPDALLVDLGERATSRPPLPFASSSSTSRIHPRAIINSRSVPWISTITSWRLFLPSPSPASPAAAVTSRRYSLDRGSRAAPPAATRRCRSTPPSSSSASVASAPPATPSASSIRTAR